MASDTWTVVFGVLSLVFYIGILFELLFLYPSLKKKILEAQGVVKVILATHGTKSWYDIEKEYTNDYSAGIDREAILEQIAIAYEDRSIEDLERENPFSGQYNPASDIQNVNALKKYITARNGGAEEVSRRKKYEDLQSDALAIQIVLNNFRLGGHPHEAVAAAGKYYS